MEDIYEANQLRPGDQFAALPPLASVPAGVVVVGPEVSPAIDRDHDGHFTVADVRQMVAPAPVILGEVSGVVCECGQPMFAARHWPDGRTLYRCQCGLHVTF